MEPIFAKKTGYKRIYIDLPGMGKTKAADWIINSDVMLEIVMAFIQKVIPGERFLLVGQSYGGYLSAWCVAQSKCFDAAVVSAPVADMASHAGTSDTGFYVTPFAMRAEPSEDPGRYERLSPVSYFDDVSRPVLLLNGENDQRCPVGQVEQLFASLVRSGKADATMVLYPGGTHSLAGSGRPSHRQNYHERIVDFVEARRANFGTT